MSRDADHLRAKATEARRLAGETLDRLKKTSLNAYAEELELKADVLEAVERHEKGRTP